MKQCYQCKQMKPNDGLRKMVPTHQLYCMSCIYRRSTTYAFIRKNKLQMEMKEESYNRLLNEQMGSSRYGTVNYGYSFEE